MQQRSVTRYPQPWIMTLTDSLERLDTLLEHALASVQAAQAQQGVPDNPYRGVYISPEDAQQQLEQAALRPMLHTPPPTGEDRLRGLRQRFGLTAFEIDVILLALAPELDSRYERMFIFLQDDITRKLPTVDLALRLLAETAEENLLLRRYLLPSAPLLRYGLVRLTPDDKQTPTPFIQQTISLEPRLVAALLGHDALPAHLSAFCERATPQHTLDMFDEAQQRTLVHLLDMNQPATHFQAALVGDNDDAKRAAAEALAAACEQHLLLVNLDAIDAADWPQTAQALALEARLQDAVLYLCGAAKPYLPALDDLPLLVTDPLWRDGALIHIHFAPASYRQQYAIWQDALHSTTHEPDAIPVLAGRFRLRQQQIEAAVRTANATHAANTPIPLATLLAAVRTQTRLDLGRLAQPLHTNSTWDDLILKDETKQQLHEICERVSHHHRIMDEWGFAQKLSAGRGVNVLFAGPPGTGKTMGGGVIANFLGLALYKVDLSGVISKYIGETEKNLNRIFDAAQGTNVVLLFDEADALFGKRSEVRDSHDRYANMEISFLLQRMEAYDGIAILATNLRNNLDKAFLRRMAFVVNFTIPEAPQRRQIWQRMIPPQTPLTADVDFDFLAQQFKLAGGNIKNIVVAAAFLAATEGVAVGMPQLIAAIRREYQKLGRVCSRKEFGPYFDLLDLETR